jgi:serine/threonine protein kinase
MEKVITYVTNSGVVKNVIIEKQIGEGGFGKVYKGILDGVGYVAIKVQKLNREIFNSLITEVKIRNTLGAMSDFAVPVERVLFHPIFFKAGASLPKNEFISISDKIPKDSAVSIYPFAGDIDLFELVLAHHKTKTTFTKDIIIRYTKELVLGLKNLHEKGIAHRDIKPENIMLGEGKLKYIDFGFACFYAECKGRKGTPHYMAPELFLSGQEIEWDKTDIFSLGNTLFFVMTIGKDVIEDETILTSNPDIVGITIRQKIERYLSGENSIFIPLITGMTEPNKNERMSAEECLEWIEQNL